MREDESKCSACGEGATTAEMSSARSANDPILTRLRSELAANFSVKRELGRGGQAQVYLAEDRALTRLVAIKVLSRFTGANEEAIHRLRLEARTVASFQHPHIVKLFAVKHLEDLHLLIMQYLGGRPLAEIVRASGALPLSVTRTIIHQIGGALDYAHARGVVHRDIKPANVLFDGDGNAVLTDFGIAKQVRERGITQTSAALGTPTYMSPEQCFGDPVTPASDQYALGVMIFEILAGEPPFRGTELAVMQGHADGPVPSLRDRWSACPPPVDAALRRMLAKSPGDRFPSVGAALAAIGASEATDTSSHREALKDWVFAEERSSGRVLTPTMGTIPLPMRGEANDSRSKKTSATGGLPESAVARKTGGVPVTDAGSRGSKAEKVSSASSGLPDGARPRVSPKLAVGALLGLGAAVAIFALVRGRGEVSQEEPKESDTTAAVVQGPVETQTPGSSVNADTSLVRDIVGLPRAIDRYLSDGEYGGWRTGKAVDSANRVLPGVGIAYEVENPRIARISGDVLFLLDTGSTALLAKAGGLPARRIPLRVLPDSGAVTGEDRAGALTAAIGQLEALLRAANTVGMEQRLDPGAVRGEFDALSGWIRGAVGTSVTCSKRDAARYQCELETKDRGTRSMLVELSAESTAEDGWHFWVVSLSER